MQAKTILVVDDEEINFILIQEMLDEYGYTILKAENGLKAFELCQKNDAIELVLMDVKMPVMDGYTSTEKIKEIRPNLPIIAQTAHALSGDRELALSKGCDEYISKPINRTRLIELVDYFVTKR
jgi:CheY-like chemotaxis protein